MLFLNFTCCLRFFFFTPGWWAFFFCTCFFFSKRNFFCFFLWGRCGRLLCNRLSPERCWTPVGWVLNPWVKWISVSFFSYKLVHVAICAPFFLLPVVQRRRRACSFFFFFFFCFFFFFFLCLGIWPPGFFSCHASPVAMFGTPPPR